MATHSDICAWRIPMDREAWWATVHVATESETPKHSSRIYIYIYIYIPITESDLYFVKYYFRIILHLDLDSK